MREADERMLVAIARSDRQSYKDEIERLREQVGKLGNNLARARRCLAAERHGREQLRLRLAAEERDYEFGVSILCRLAFPGES